MQICIFFLSLPWPRCLNNEHEDSQEIHLKFDFERSSCTNEIDFEKDMDDETLPLEMMRLVNNENKQILPHQEIIEIINLGNNKEKKEVKISTSLPVDTKKEIINLLHESVNVFAWSYQDMPGLSTKIVKHKLPFMPILKPIQQKLRRIKLDMLLKIKAKAKKQFDARFLEVAKYLEWVANIIHVPKKDGKVRMCVDY